MAISGIQGGNNPYIIIEESVSNHGFTSLKPVERAFGKVKVISAGCNQFALEDSVFFNKEKSSKVRSGGGVTYYIVDQQDIFFTETPAS